VTLKGKASATAIGRLVGTLIAQRNDMAAKKKPSTRKYGSKVGSALHEQKHGTLRAGRSGKKVKSRKQAVAIGLSQARKSGSKVPAKRQSAASH